MNGRTLCRIAAIAAWAVLTAGAAAAQDPDAPPPGTVTLGPVRIVPGLVLNDLGVDDNVFNDPIDPKRDFTFTLTPRADVTLRVRRLRLGYNTSADYVYYQTYSSERGVNGYSSGRVDVDLGNLKPYASITGVNTRARLNSEVDARARHHDLSYAAGLTLKIASRTSLLSNYTQGKVSYESGEEFRGVDLSQAFDGRRRSLDAGIGLALTPLTTFSVLVAREEQRFDLSPDRDADTWRVSPTFSFSPTGLIRGTASVGYRRFRPLSSTLPPYSGLVSTVGIGATIYGRHQMQAQFSRDVQYSYDLSNDYYLGTGGTITWTWLLVGPLDVRGTAGRYLMDYRGGGQLAADDHTTTYGGGVGYRFTTYLRLGANVLYNNRSSQNSPDRAYRNHRFFVGLTWGITP